jgi:hypothetical protein
VTALEQWRAPSADHYFTQGVNNTSWASNVYNWTTGLGAKTTVPADALARAWGATCTVNVSQGAMWWRFVCELAAGGGKAAATSYWPNTNGFKVAPPTGTEVSASLQAGGQLLGDQAATFYLQARADVAGTGSFTYPTVRLTTYAP